MSFHLADFQRIPEQALHFWQEEGTLVGHSTWRGRVVAWLEAKREGFNAKAEEGVTARLKKAVVHLLLRLLGPSSREIEQRTALAQQFISAIEQTYNQEAAHQAQILLEKDGRIDGRRFHPRRVHQVLRQVNPNEQKKRANAVLASRFVDRAGAHYHGMSFQNALNDVYNTLSQQPCYRNIEGGVPQPGAGGHYKDYSALQATVREAIGSGVRPFLDGSQAQENEVVFLSENEANTIARYQIKRFLQPLFEKALQAQVAVVEGEFSEPGEDVDPYWIPPAAEDAPSVKSSFSQKPVTELA